MQLTLKNLKGNAGSQPLMQGSVVLDRATNRRLAHYAGSTGQEVSAVANEAINHYMDTIGDTVLEELGEAAPVMIFPGKAAAGGGRLVEFPHRPAS